METHFEDLDTRPLSRASLLALFSAPGYADAADDADDDTPTQAIDTAAMRAEAGQTTTWRRADPLPPPSPLPPERPQADDPAAVLEAHARAELVAGRTLGAKALCERAMTVRRGHLGEADPALPSSFSDLGGLCLHLGKIDEARWHFEQAHELLGRRGDRESPERAAIDNNLGVVAHRSGDDELAWGHYETSLRAKLAVYGWEHRSVALTMVNLGRVAERLGDDSLALWYYAHARMLAERTEGAVGPALAASLLGLGRIQMSRGEETAAIFAFERALRVRESIVCPPIQLASARFALARALIHTAELRAIELVRAAIRDYRATDAARSDVIEMMTEWLVDHQPPQAAESSSASLHNARVAASYAA